MGSKAGANKLEPIYCVKCRSFTENKGKIKHKVTSNGKKYVIVKCAICGKEKSKFT